MIPFLHAATACVLATMVLGAQAQDVAGDPAATIQKMQQVRSAALAPAEPSSQDMSVAAKASRLESQARAELAASNTSGDTSSDHASSSSKRDASALIDEGTTAGKTSLSQSSLATPSTDPLQQRVQVIAQRYDNAWRPSGLTSFNSYA